MMQISLDHVCESCGALSQKKFAQGSESIVASGLTPITNLTTRQLTVCGDIDLRRGLTGAVVLKIKDPVMNDRARNRAREPTKSDSSRCPYLMPWSEPGKHLCPSR